MSARTTGLALALGAAALLGLSLPAAADEIRVLHYGGSMGGAMRQSYFDPAEKELGITVKDMSRTDLAKIKAMVQSGNIEVDVVSVNTMEVGRGALEGLWEPIDWSMLDPRIAGSVGQLKYGVPESAFAFGVAYNTKTYPDPQHAPQSWADFWDEKKFPGKRAFEDRVRYQLEFAVLAAGVPADKLYPLDADLAFRKLDEIKPNVLTWAKPPVQTVQLLANGDVVMAPGFNNEVYNAQKRGAPVKMVWNQALYLTASWVIVKGTPHYKLAMQFIKTITQPAYEARQAEAILYGPMNPDALALVKPELRAELPTNPDNLRQLVPFNTEWWAHNEAALIERWQKWVIQ